MYIRRPPCLFYCSSYCQRKQSLCRAAMRTYSPTSRRGRSPRGRH